MECQLQNITLHYEVFGDGRPLILLPGWGMNTRLTAIKKYKLSYVHGGDY